jgi:heme/copper-type cytochrome/quinol oxidase subunit 2
VAGPRTVEVKAGTSVVLEVLADVVDEIHVHGYDLKMKTVPGTPVRIVFAATIPGVFEVELHSGVKLCDLRVR